MTDQTDLQVRHSRKTRTVTPVALSLLCGIIALLSPTAKAETTKTVWNPFTGRLDFITSLNGLNWPTTGSGCLQLSGGVLSYTSCSGGGGISGQINNANQNDIPYYSVAGSSNVLSGNDSFTWNGSTVSVSAWFNMPRGSTISVYGIFQASGSVGNVGQILASNGPGQPPTFIDPVVSQTTDSNLNASVSIKGSSNTVQVTGTPSVTSTYTVVTDTWNVNVNIAGGSIANTGFNVNNTPAVTQSGGPWTVIQTTSGANASTMTVIINGQPTIANTGFNVNNTPAVTQSGGPWTVIQTTSGANASTMTVIINGQPTIANTGFNVNNAPTVVQSTAATNGSTIAVTNAVGTQLTVVSTGIPVTFTTPYSIYVATVSALISGSSNTVSFGGIGQPVTSTYTVVTDTWNVPVQVLNSTVGVQGIFADNGVAAGTNRETTAPSIYQTDYLNGTAATQGRNGALSQGTDGLLWTATLPAMRPASYSASTITVTIAASPTDIAALCGNANNTVLLYNIRASCNQTTAGTILLSVAKRSSGYTGAWSTMTAAPQDSNYSAVQSTAVFFTANPTVGTLLGYLDDYRLFCPPSTTSSPNDIYISPADWRMKPIVLRGSSQCVGLNLQSNTVTGGAFAVTFSWMEVKTITP